MELFRNLLNETDSQLCFVGYLKTPVLLKSFFQSARSFEQYKYVLTSRNQEEKPFSRFMRSFRTENISVR